MLDCKAQCLTERTNLNYSHQSEKLTEKKISIGVALSHKLRPMQFYSSLGTVAACSSNIPKQRERMSVLLNAEMLAIIINVTKLNCAFVFWVILLLLTKPEIPGKSLE